MLHNHRHNHASEHSHEHNGMSNERRVFWAMLLTGSFMLAEVIGGLISGSLALLADAGHMLTDFASLLLAWFAFRLSRRPADPERTYGYYRFEILAAFINGITLFAIVAWIFYQAVHRFLEPVEILGGMMMVVGVIGLAVNVVAFLILYGAETANLNIRGATVHVLGDLFGSIGAIVAAAIILWTGWTSIDPILSVAIGLLILRSAWFIVTDSAHILLQGTPQNIDIDRIAVELRDTIPEVLEVHHVHAWSLTPKKLIMTLHVRVDGDADRDSVVEKVNALLEEHWGVAHATIQVERKPMASPCTESKI